MLKKILAILLTGLMLFGVVGCSLKPSSDVSGIENGSDTLVAGKKINQAKPGKVANGFTEALIKGDFATIRELIYTDGDDTFFTAKDVEWYMPRSAFADFTAKVNDDQQYKVVSQELKTTGSQSSYRVTATDKDDNAISLLLNLQLNNENKWFVLADEFYVANWHFVTPGGETKVLIDGTILPDAVKNTSYGSQGLRKLHTIDCIGKSEKKIELSAEKGFGNKEFAVNPMSNSEEDPLVCTVDVTDEKIYQGIADLFNSCSELVEQGKSASDLMPFVSLKADTNVANAMFSGIKNAGSSLSGKLSGFRCSNVRPCSDPDMKSYYLTDTVAYVAFNYNMTWNYKLMNYTKTENMQNYAELVIDTSDNKCSVYDAKDRFFSWFNSATNKSK